MSFTFPTLDVLAVSVSSGIVGEEDDVTLPAQDLNYLTQVSY